MRVASNSRLTLDRNENRPLSFIMRAMVLDALKQPLQFRDVTKPRSDAGQILMRVSTCAVCRTDLHIVDGELPNPKLPLIPGHEIVGRVEEIGTDVKKFREGDRVGIPWLGWTCGECKFCRSGRENLCDRARFTGYNIDGGYAEFVVADARFCFPIPDDFEDIAAAPLLCAGLIGFRSLRKCGDPKRLGLYGFGAAAHIICQVALFEGRKVFAFTRPGDIQTQKFAQRLGATWTGGSDQAPPEKMDAAIIFAPVGALMPVALRHLEKGGMVISAGIHMSDIPAFPYHDLWGERALCSVANLTRRDGAEFFEIAPRVPVRTESETFPLEQANEALTQLGNGKLNGAAVLVMDAG